MNKKVIVTLRNGTMKVYFYSGKSNVSGGKIKLLREKVHLSQEQLAIKLELSGIQFSQQSISRIEQGQRFITDYELMKLAEILKFSVYYLLTGEEADPFSSPKR